MNRNDWFNLATAPLSQTDFWLEIKDLDMVSFTVDKCREYILYGLQ